MNGPRRTAPGWFVAELKALSPRLTVTWRPEKQRWLIEEAVPWAVHIGWADGSELYRIGRRGQRVVWAKELGGRVLEWIRRVDVTRFSNQAEMMKKLDMESSYHGCGLAANLTQA